MQTTGRCNPIQSSMLGSLWNCCGGTAATRTMARTALITGVCGQDGAYLAKLLLAHGYRVLGQIRRDAAPQTAGLAELGVAELVEFVNCDLLDIADVRRMLDRFRPDEIYNLAGASPVASSFDQPMAAFDANAITATRLLEVIRLSAPEVRFFQSSTSEMFGASTNSPQDETTPFRPRSPYAAAKLAAHALTVSFRESYGLFSTCGILFNHESPLRPPNFVTRKITSGLAEVKHGVRSRLTLGNLDVQRDWGFAADYVEAMRLMLQRSVASEYVIATGISTSVRRFVELAADCLDMRIEWSGSGASETGVDRVTSRTVIVVDPALFRPADLMATVGDASRAHRELGWRSKVDLKDLVGMMVNADERRLLDRKVLA